jgi:acyl-CoA reductase-like NAD-dependent aldehyde dehydrogenase
MDSEPARRAFLFALEAHLRAAERHEASADLLTQHGKRDWAEVARARAAAERRAYADALRRRLGGRSVRDRDASGSSTSVIRIAPVDGH